MRVCIVLEDIGDYDGSSTSVVAVFTRREDADSHVAALQARPGAGHTYQVQEADVWDGPATNTVVIWRMDEIVSRGRHPKGKPYRVACVIREGDESSLWHSEVHAHEGDSRYVTVRVAAPTAEAARDAYERAYAQWAADDGHRQRRG